MSLNDKLEIWRKDLIDMSKRNPLLYYKSDGPRAAGIEFLPENPSALFAHLSDRPGFIELDSLPCAISQEDLERHPLSFRLLRLQTRVREDERDRGIRTLYMIFGMLEWYETADSQELIRSPLIFVPVKLERDAAADSYTAKFADDREFEINPTLREKLNHDFKMLLPTYDEITNGENVTALTLEILLRAITEKLPGDERWSVSPEVHLGRFAFQKLAIYQDLGRQANHVLAHPLLKVIAGDEQSPSLPSWLPAPNQLDQMVPPQRVLEVLDADSSQQEAIQLAKADVSFVLKGPPGTGKSQTIANIIAETLGQGKKVLFVSEKMAALEVVRDRLKAAGLGEFCLDMHNARTTASQKASFVSSLKSSLNDADMQSEVGAEASWERQSSNLTARRDELNSYVEDLHRTRAPLGISVFEAYGELAQLADVTDHAFAIPDIGAITQERLARMLSAIDQLSACRDVLDAYDTHPWRETRAKTYSRELQSTISARFSTLAGHLRALNESHATMLRLMGENAAPTLAWLPYVVERVQAVLASPLPLPAWLRSDELARLRPVAADMAARSKVYAEHLHQFEPIYNRSILSEDLAGLKQALTDASSRAIGCIREQMGSPYDTAIAYRDELDAKLTSAGQALSSIATFSNELADMCGNERPVTLGDVGRSITVAAHLLQTPNPPSGWLNSSDFVVARATAAEAKELFTQRAQMRSALEGVYQAQFFTLDLQGMAERFRTQYVAFFRILQAPYRRDIKLVRSLLQPGQVRTPAQIEVDIYLAVKLLDNEKTLTDKRILYAQALGYFYDGPQTDWKTLGSALRWVNQLHQFMAGAPIPSTMASLISGPAMALRSVGLALERLVELYSSWKTIEPFCQHHIHIKQLLHGLGSFDDATSNAVCHEADNLLSELRIFWQAVETVRSHRHVREGSQHPGQWSRLCADVELAQNIRDFETNVADASERYTSDFGHFFRGVRTDWQPVLNAIDWTSHFLRLYTNRDIPDSVVSLVSYPVDAIGQATLRDALTHAQHTLPEVNSELGFSDTIVPRSAITQPGKAFETSSLTVIAERVDSLNGQLPALASWLICQDLLNHCRQVGLGSLVENLLRHRPIPTNISAVFRRRFYKLWLDSVDNQSPTLKGFLGSQHSNAIQVFRDLDRNHNRLAQKRLRAMLLMRRHQLVGVPVGEKQSELAKAIAALRREVQLKRHKSVRVIVQKTAPALLELRPCWMMSPLSVSQFLSSGNQIFDLVIFDEASQVCPEDSISSILRGKQLIVVGDPMQLPPTRFFTRSLADGNGDEDDEAEESEGRTQSILEECLASGFAIRSLQWHYRSADEALIAFSNHHFYDDRLITFPSAHGGKDQGVQFVYVANSNYKRGQNSNEAARVADIVFDYLQRHENCSLGIVALSAAQQDTISEILVNRMKREPSLSRFENILSSEDPNGIFIKNLESVQGDERDTIILSIGYGPDASGTIYRRFGPVNNAGGERRLNVAVTRARKQIIVVSSMRAQDLPPDMTSKGSRILRDYLQYAEACSKTGAEGGKQVLANRARESEGSSASLVTPQFDSPFEEAVYNTLTARGLTLDTQVGCSRYRIDMAVRKSERSGSYLLGIECDGATYHSSKTARDRDRLRQWQLERMGWTIHRIWSSDWIANPGREVQRVLDAVSDILSERNNTDTTGEPNTDVGDDPKVYGPEGDEPTIQDGKPYRPAETAVAALPDNARDKHVVSSRLGDDVVQSVEVKRRSETSATSVVPASGQPLPDALKQPDALNGKRETSALPFHRDQVKSGISLSNRACEDCTYFQRRSPTDFRCGWNGELKEADNSGHTPACTAWKQAQ